MTALGLISLTMGVFGVVASIIRAALGDDLKSHNNEMSAIGWFILAVLCLR